MNRILCLTACAAALFLGCDLDSIDVPSAPDGGSGGSVTGAGGAGAAGGTGGSGGEAGSGNAMRQRWQLPGWACQWQPARIIGEASIRRGSARIWRMPAQRMEDAATMGPVGPLHKKGSSPSSEAQPLYFCGRQTDGWLDIDAASCA